MSYEGMFPLPDYDGGPQDQYDDWIAELQAARQEKLDEIERIIAKAVHPWIGDDAVYSQGQAKMNREMSFRAGKAAVEALVKEGKI